MCCMQQKNFWINNQVRPFPHLIMLIVRTWNFWREQFCLKLKLIWIVLPFKSIFASQELQINRYNIQNWLQQRECQLICKDTSLIILKVSKEWKICPAIWRVLANESQHCVNPATLAAKGCCSQTRQLTLNQTIWIQKIYSTFCSNSNWLW